MIGSHISVGRHHLQIFDITDSRVSLKNVDTHEKYHFVCDSRYHLEQQRGGLWGP